MQRQNLIPMSSSYLLSMATAICILGLTACAPLPPKAVIVKDNIVKNDIVKDDIVKDEEVTILPVEVVVDNVTEITAPNDLVDDTQDNTTTTEQAPISDNISEQEQAKKTIGDSQQKVATFKAPKPISPQTLLKEPLKPKPQEPDPLDPHIFLDKSQSYLFDIIGKPDDQFTEQGIQVGQYRESTCHLLTFLASQKGSLHVIHIDVRPTFLNSALDKNSCYKAFGKRADQIQNN